MIELNNNIVLTSVDFDPFTGGVVISHLAPSTDSQKEIWTSCKIGGDDANRAYNESISLVMDGPLNVSALENSLITLIKRNESLRSVFSADGKQMIILKEIPFKLVYQDLSDLVLLEQNNFIHNHLKSEVLKVFSLTDGPLLRLTLLKLAQSKHLLTINCHHIICDGWSIGIILQDIAKSYSSYINNRHVDSSVTFPFTNFAFDQSLFLQTEAYKAVEKFWQKKFDDNIPVLNLPTDFQRPNIRTYKSDRLDYSIDQKLISDLKEIGVRNGCSLVTTLMAIFNIFLHKYTRQDDLIVGLPTASQAAMENDRLIGHCVNLLPIRSKLNSEVSFLTFLKDLKNELLDVYEFQQISFGSLLKLLKIPRDLTRVPLIPVVFNIDIGLTDGVEFDGLSFQMQSNAREFESFDIFLNVSGSDQLFVFEWSYNTGLFKSSSIDQMMAGFEKIITSVIANPTMPIKNIQLLDTGDYAKPASESVINDIPADFVINLINKSAITYREKTALVFRDKLFSFKDLNQKANQFARHLTQKGIRKGQIVALALDRSPEIFISVLAIMKLGATFLPVDPELPQERIRFILEDSSAVLLITSAKYAEDTAFIEHLFVEEGLLAADFEANSNLPLDISGNDVAYIIYTSGSTGQPKGVLIGQEAIANYINYSIREYSTDVEANAGTFFHLSLSFDASLTAFFVPLITGKTIVISAENTLEVFNDPNIIKYAPYDFIKLTPAQLYLLKAAHNRNTRNITSRLVIGGEALYKRHIDFLINGHMDVEIINEYGPTEATVGCIAHKFNTLGTIQEDQNGILIGQPTPNVNIYILDSNLNPVPRNATGEIYIGGIQLATGYLNRTELTNERFIVSPFSSEITEKIYRTGDLGKYTLNGDIGFMGRIDDQLKLRGYRIEPAEIELLLTSQEAIEHAYITVEEDKPGDQRLVAYVVTKQSLSDSDFIQAVKQWKQVIRNGLPKYMVPSQFLQLHEVPLTANGKIDKRKLRQSPLAIAPSIDHYTPMELLICDIWKKEIGTQQVGIHDDFFELGGHSLLAIEIMSIIGKKIERTIPVSKLLEFPTVQKLAAELEKGTNLIRWKSLVPLKSEGNKTPIYMVHGAGLGVMVFNEIVASLDKERPFFALQGLGINGGDEPLESVEETAALYVSEILQHNPTGPYILGGYSDGGIIAYEMAKQLQAAGKMVEMLAILDTCIEVTKKHKFDRFSVRFKRSVIRLLPRLYHELYCFYRFPRQAWEYQKDCIKNRIRSFARMAGVKFMAKSNENLIFIDRAIEKYEYAVHAYNIQPYDGSIDLFRSTIRMNYVADPKSLGWKSFAQRGIRIHDIPGDHEDMLLPGNCAQFMRIFQDAIADR